MNGHSSKASALTDYKGSRPSNLLPRDRKFPDQERVNLWSPCSNCSSDENNSPTALNTFNWDKPALEDKSVDFGWSPATDKSNGITLNSKHPSSSQIAVAKNQKAFTDVSTKDFKNTSECKKSPKKNPKLSESLNSSQVKSLYPTKDGVNYSTNELTTETRTTAFEDDLSQTESFRSEEDLIKEKEDLKNAAWFQAGIPREIALEVLAEKPEGSFIVRESTTKPGCYALSVRVPPGKNPDGIAHYLILRTNKGYKIKGFTKEFSNLKSLITHHSVMPELLPCPLSLCKRARDAEHEFEDTEQKTCDIFSDIHWIMTDLEL